LRQAVFDLREMAGMTGDDQAMVTEVGTQFADLERQYQELEFFILFSGEHDRSDVVLSIHAGTGGVDAQDFAQMLLRMYLRFCERHDLDAKVIDETAGNEAGIKSVTLAISGHYAYGWLRSENGVHRLVRISPFDSEGMRHTSFALVEVLPKMETAPIEIKDDDLQIEVFRAGGNGGQSVNTTDSAVRITHLPTGIAVKCQNERSQVQNRQRAMEILHSKLAVVYRAMEKQKVQDIRGQYQQAQWGNQARSYVLQPYQLVKDHRTDYEATDIDRVLDGQIDDFVEHYLRQLRSQAN